MMGIAEKNAEIAPKSESLSKTYENSDLVSFLNEYKGENAKKK